MVTRLKLELFRGKSPDGVLAVSESLVQRATPALLMLLLASATGDPAVVGLGAAITLVLTLYGAVIEIPCRMTLQHSQWSAKTKTAGVIGALFFSGLLLLVIVTLTRSVPVESIELVALLLIPLVPTVNLAGLARVARTQVVGAWSDIALSRVEAASLSLAVALGAVWLCTPLTGFALQITLFEFLFYLSLWRRTRGTVKRGPSTESGKARLLWQFQVTSTFGWFAGQFERLIVLFLGGPALLGTFAIGYALGRAPGDALTAGLANLASTTSRQPSGRSVAAIEASLQHVWNVAVLASAATIGGLFLFVRPLLGPAFDAALVFATLLAASGPLNSLGWVSTIFLNASGRYSIVTKVQTLQLGLSAVSGAMMLVDLRIGAAAVVLRLCLTSFILARSCAVRSKFTVTRLAATCAMVIVSGSIVVVAY